jgi:hypothetical protein
MRGHIDNQFDLLNLITELGERDSMRHALCLFVAFLFASPAIGQNFKASEPRAIAQKMLDMGYKAQLGEFEGDPVIESSSDGSSFSLYFAGCDKGKQCEVVEFFDIYSFKKENYVSLRQLVDEWNSENYAKAHIIDDSIYLTFPVIMNYEGLGPKLFQSNFDTWISELSDFRKKLVDATPN